MFNGQIEIIKAIQPKQSVQLEFKSLPADVLWLGAFYKGEQYRVKFLNNEYELSCSRNLNGYASTNFKCRFPRTSLRELYKEGHIKVLGIVQ